MEPCRHRALIAGLRTELRDAVRRAMRSGATEERLARIAVARRHLAEAKTAQQECRYCQEGN